MTSQRDLGDRFFQGYTSGTASNVAIEETEHTTRLVGYGWAVYAIRFKDTGETVYFEGWRGYSRSTSAQLTKMGLGMCDYTVDKAPTRISRAGHPGITEFEESREELLTA